MEAEEPDLKSIEDILLVKAIFEKSGWSVAGSPHEALLIKKLSVACLKIDKNLKMTGFLFGKSIFGIQLARLSLGSIKAKLKLLEINLFNTYGLELPSTEKLLKIFAAPPVPQERKIVKAKRGRPKRSLKKPKIVNDENQNCVNLPENQKKVQKKRKLKDETVAKSRPVPKRQKKK